VLPSDSRATEEAFEFIKFLASHEGHELLCNGHNKISARTTQTEAFKSNHEHPHLKVFQDLARSPHAGVPPQIGIWSAYQREMNVAVDTIWQDKDAVVRDVLQRVQDKMQKLLNQELEERAKRRRKRALQRGVRQ
jgi:multiple sugar transport system substrate-binding protein